MPFSILQTYSGSGTDVINEAGLRKRLNTNGGFCVNTRAQIRLQGTNLIKTFICKYNIDVYINLQFILFALEHQPPGILFQSNLYTLF